MSWKRSPTWLLALSTAVLTFAALAHVWVRLQMLAVGYDISRETKWRHDLGEQNQRLTLELRTRMDLSVVEQGKGKSARRPRPGRSDAATAVRSA